MELAISCISDITYQCELTPTPIWCDRGLIEIGVGAISYVAPSEFP